MTLSTTSLKRAQAARHLAVDVNSMRRVIEILRDQDIADVLHAANFRATGCRNLVGCVLIVTGSPECRSARAAQDSRRRPPGRRTGSTWQSSGRSSASLLADAPHVLVTANFVLLLQADLHKCGVLSGIGGVDRENPASRRCWKQSYPSIAAGTTSRISPSTCFMYWLGQLQARASRSLDVDHELAGIGARKEGQTQQRVQRAG